MTDRAPSDVKILVKNVYAPAESQQFVVVDSLPVRALKDMLAAALPGNPAPKHQKLIFGGKICDDDLTLARVLAGQSAQQDAAFEDAAPFVFHLMVSSAVQRSRPPTPEANARPTPAPAPTPATPVAAAAPTPAPAPTAATLPQPPAAAASPFAAFPAPPAASATPASPLDHHHQLFQQAYLMQQQAMILSQIQYLQQLHAHHAASAHATPGAHDAQPQAQAHGMFPPFGHFGHHYAHMYGMPHPAAYGVNPAAHAAHVGGIPAPNVPGAQVPAAPAAEAAAAVPRERGPIVQAFREILPLFDIRLALKMSFMLFIIGQDTPTDRLIVLALMSFGAYLHITGIVAKVFEILKRSRGTQGDDANAAQNPNDPNGNPVPNAQDRLGSVAQYLRISSDRGFLHDVRYFFTGLLLSLVPAWHPQPLNVDPAAPARPEPIIADAGAEIPMQGI